MGQTSARVYTSCVHAIGDLVFINVEITQVDRMEWQFIIRAGESPVVFRVATHLEFARGNQDHCG